MSADPILTRRDEIIASLETMSDAEVRQAMSALLADVAAEYHANARLMANAGILLETRHADIKAEIRARFGVEERRA